MTVPAVELRSVNKTYGSFTALHDLDLVVPPRSFFCLLGSSGSGKSTALRLVAGLEQITRGEVLIGNVPMNSTPPHQRPVNTVFQSYGLFPRMSLFDNVAYGLRAKGVAKKEIARRVADALAMVRMSDQRGKKPSQLSGGQQQRGALARALVNEPSVLLLDEPLGALDLQLRRDMQGELVRLHARTETTFIHVTHDQEEAFACATHVGVISEGRLHQVGSPDQLYRRPRNAFVADFVGSANMIPVQVQGKDGDSYVVRGSAGLARAGSWQSWKPGETCTLVVRPEDIDVTDQGGDQPGDLGGEWVPGRLESRVSSGSTVRLNVRVGDTSLVVERLASPSAELVAGPGDAVAVRMSRESGWLVPAESAATEGPTTASPTGNLTSEPVNA